MIPLLIDEGLSSTVAVGLRAVSWPAHAVGDEGAPPLKSIDEVNCEWCAEHEAVLVTNDLGKTDRTIFNSLATYRVHAVFVYDDLRGPPHLLLRALLCAEKPLEDYTSRRKLLRARLRPNGRLETR